MATTFEPSTPADLDAIAALMQGAFGSAPDAPYLDRKLLHWKYYARIDDCDRPRSYVVRQGQNILAHGCLWPVGLRAGGHVHPAVCLIDWASDKASAGMGMMLLRKLETVSPTLLAIAGSDMTRQILPRLGFRTAGDMPVYARVVRPYRQARSRPREGWARDTLRFGRNLIWRLRPLPAANEWKSLRLETPASLPFTAAGEAIHSVHTCAAIGHMLRCPAGGAAFFGVSQASRERGWFMLSYVRGQTRIVDLRIDSGDPDDWLHAYALAARTAAADPRTCELVAFGSTESVNRILEQNGFRVRGRRPVFLRDAANLLGEPTALHLNMLDDDSAYIDVPGYPYVT